MLTFFEKKVSDKSKFENKKMKTYIISIILVSVVGSIISVLSPDGEGGGLAKHTRLAVGLCLVLVCTTPIASFIRGLEAFDPEDYIPQLDGEESLEYESIFNSSYSEAEVENLREGIKTILYEKFNVEPSECYVFVKISEGDVGERRLLRIFINLYGSAVWKDSGAIESYLSSLFRCETVIAVG